MTSTTVAVVFVAGLCLAFPETRWMGIVGIALLAYMYPLSVILLVVAAVLAVVLHLYRKRSSYHALSGPDSQID